MEKSTNFRIEALLAERVPCEAPPPSAVPVLGARAGPLPVQSPGVYTSAPLFSALPALHYTGIPHISPAYEQWIRASLLLPRLHPYTGLFPAHSPHLFIYSTRFILLCPAVFYFIFKMCFYSV